MLSISFRAVGGALVLRIVSFGIAFTIAVTLGATERGCCVEGASEGYRTEGAAEKDAWGKEGHFDLGIRCWTIAIALLGDMERWESILLQKLEASIEVHLPHQCSPKSS